MKAKHRRRAHLFIALMWLGPGAVASYLWAHSVAWIVVAWIVAMSWFACVYAAFSAHAAETPDEEEQ